MADPLPSVDERRRLAERMRYEGHPKHKERPRAFRMKPMRPVSEDATYCDGHAGFQPSDMARLPELMRRGVEAGLIGAQERDGNPSLL